MGISVVTGANRGIGLALCSALLAEGRQVVGACRKSSPELDALGVEVIEGVDVSSQEGVAVLKEGVGARSIELLINNAGVLVWGDSIDELDFEGMRLQFEVNAIGPLRVTSALRPNLEKGSKVAFITSRMGSVADNGSGGAYGYRMSKAALNIAGVSVARDLAKLEVAAVLLHPGMVKTEMIGRHNGQVEPQDAALGLLARISELTLESSGTFWHQNGEELPW